MNTLYLDGTAKRGSTHTTYLIELNDEKIFLQGKSFSYLAQIAVAAATDQDGWIHRDSLEPGSGENASKHVSNLRHALGKRGKDIIRNNGNGSYGINNNTTAIIIETDGLRAFPDYEIQLLADTVEAVL